LFTLTCFIASMVFGRPGAAQTLLLIDDARLPRFEAASVKPGDPNASGGMISFAPGQFRQENMELLSAFASAFGVRPYQIAPMPDFLLRQRFTITARMPAGAPATDRALMLRALFIDRFKLRYHVEHQEEDGFALTLARADGRLGPKLRHAPVDCGAWLAARAQGTPVEPLPPTAAACGVRNGQGLLDFGGMPMQAVAQMLSNQLGRPVIDRTGLTGPFDVVEFQFLQSSAGAPRPGDAAIRDDAASIYTAVQEQLGLKLIPARAPVDRLVIDHIEAPAPD
jgi:uncharacterized protein (TIGR03435 family)